MKYINMRTNIAILIVTVGITNLLGSVHGYNYTNVIKNYLLMCGPEYLCDDSKLELKHIPNISIRHLNLCPECSCTKTCIAQENCCPDVYFQFMDQTCEDSIIFDSTGWNLTDKYPIVKTCPKTADNYTTNLCLRSWTLIEKIRLSPVTSLHSNINFMNKYCAACNGEDVFYDWELDISCNIFYDFNYLSSYQEVLDQAMVKNCTIRHKPNFTPDRNCALEANVTYYRCNITGLWKTFDPDIQYACESTYILTHRTKYKNIFCLMCNPIRRTERDIIITCNETGLWAPDNSELQDACHFHGQTEGMYPFKNIFCLTCNRNNDILDRFQDANATVSELPKGSHTFYFVDVNQLKLSYYDILIKQQRVHVNTVSNVSHPVNLTNALLKAYARNPSNVGLCNEYLLPQDKLEVIKPLWSSCGCDPTTTVYNLCMDISLSYPRTCTNLVIHRGFIGKMAVELFYTITNGCYDSGNISVISQRCTGEPKDLFSFIFVTGRPSAVQYKNFDCFVCNQFKYTTGNVSVKDMISPNDYTILLTIKIVCHQLYIDPTRYIFIYDFIETAKINDCWISYKKNEVYLQTCDYKNDADNIRQCNVSGNWPVLDPDINFLCENVDEAMLVPKYYKGYGRYKNTFCFLCNPVPFTEKIIKSCNETGLWDKYDQNVENGCQMLPAIYNYPPYKNKLCKICNSGKCKRRRCAETFDEYREYSKCELDNFECQCLGPGCVNPLDIPGVKIRNLFRLEEHTDTTSKKLFDKCPEHNVVYQTEGICRNVTCFPGKYLNGKNCVSLFTDTRNIRYRMELIIKGTLPQYHAYYVLYFLQLTTKSIHPWLTQFLTTASIGAVDLRMLRTLLFSNLPCRCCSSEMTNITILVHLSVDLFISSYINRYNLEKILTEIDGLPFNFSDIIFDDTTNDFSIYRANIIKDKVNDKSWNSDKCWWSYIWSANMNDFGDKYIATFVSRQILCQQYEFEPDEYVYDAIKDEMWLLQFNVRLKPEEFLRGNDGKVKVCVDDLLQYLSKTSPISKSTTELALEILTTVCSCVSMLCLLLTFVTYCCYDSLRTLPGKNNMCLILSLFIAQTCLQFGTIWTNYVTVCKVVGVVLHISWLATFGCMNVCSFHMYNTFKKVKAIKVDRSETNKLLLRYISFSFGVPICIVIVNMAVHLGQSKGRNIGYGVDACFISRRLSQVVSFIIPVVLICIVNVCLFTITAWKIHSRPKIQSTRNDRNDFFIYVKLFALTGITWLGQIIDSFFPLSLFSFVVTLLTGLQGLFIFLSYICNKRILNMISTSLHCQKSNATKSCDNQLSSSDSTKSSSLSRESSSNTFLPVDSSKL